jgi:hypothetical protein
MIVSISQPTLFPWIGYFDIIKQSDVFIFLDNVKFEKRSWQMRNKLKIILNDQEKEAWIKIPTMLDKSDTEIRNVLIDNSQNWKKNHQTTFQTTYGKKFGKIKFINQIYEKDWEKISDFNIEFIKKCCDFLRINTKILKASKMHTTGKKSNLLLDICKKTSATKYLSTIGAKEYLEKDKKIFEQEEIEIIYHNFIHPNYKQKGNQFIKNLSILDLIFNEEENSYKFFK